MYINIDIHIIHLNYFIALEIDNSFTDKTQDNISKKQFLNIQISSSSFKKIEKKKI